MKITPQMKANAALLAVIAGVVLYMWKRSTGPFDQPPEPPRTDLASMTMAQAVAHCHALWLTQHWDQAPLALAWHAQGVDWYVLSGVDTRSMRHYACTSTGIETGARYERVLQERVPAATAEPRNVLRDVNLFLHYAARPGSFGPALEAVQDPQDPVNGALAERRWLAGGSPQLHGPAPPNLPLLFSQPPPGLAAQGLPRLTALTATDWLKQPDAVFSLLGDQLPPEVRIAAIDVRTHSIKVSIVGPVKAFDGKPPAPYGDASFDEYGVRDADWWYPRESADNGCNVGYTLAEVKALYAQAVNRGHPEIWNAAFGCTPRRDGGTGAWLLRVPKKSRR